MSDNINLALLMFVPFAVIGILGGVLYHFEQKELQSICHSTYGSGAKPFESNKCLLDNGDIKGLEK